jgi:two-component system phosphate regulon sensor histidine kinase PhoR
MMNVLLLLLAVLATWLGYRLWRIRLELAELGRNIRRGQGRDSSGASLNHLGDLPFAIATLERELREQVAVELGRREVFLEIMDGLGEGILALDRERRIVLANRSVEGMLAIELPPEGRALSEAVRVSTVFTVFDQALGGSESVARFSVRTGIAERKVEIRAFPLASEAIAAVALFIDVTQLERLEQIRRNFIADFSHEVRTPLTGLRSAVESFDSTSRSALSLEDDAQLRRIMTRQLSRLERLVDDLSELSRIESGDLPLTINDVDLMQLARDLGEDFADRAAQRRVRLSIHGERALVRADAVRIQQALSNIIDNAMKYGGDGQTIEIGVTDGPDSAEVRVSDEGVGVPEPEQEHIFRRFYRVDKSRSEIAGSGLGLAITKHIVLLHRGTIDLESRPGKGATFRVRLPKSGE